MGMTNKECIDILSYPTYYCPHLREKALDMAIDTICKYQKIEEIIKNHDKDRMPEDYWYIDRIREVLENGNDK